jgi:hypothetical protein
LQPDTFECIRIYVNLCELMWIDVNLRMDCAAVRQCGKVWQYEWRCAAVRTAAVYGSALGSVWQYTRGSMWLSGSAAVRGCVWQCAWLCVAVRAAVCSSVWLYVAVSTVVSAHCAQSCAAVCGSAIGSVQCVRQCGSACVAVRECAAVRQWVAVRCVQQCQGSVW